MTIKKLTLAVLLATTMAANAANTTTTVNQVTNSVTLTDDVDYVISGTTPFSTSGSVNIANTDHAVVIISNIKPSKVISNWLSFIYINGEKAVSDVNCQVKMYNKGAIIFPYSSDIKPLTCYTESDFAGESCDDYSEGHSGGFMKTLTSSTLNNNFKSFKLKRGYMVTFALGTSGWGYSRCFIADHEDLEMNLPANMLGRVSSYRLFKWQNAKKAGLASDTGFSSTQATNASWCYSWGNGENRYPDTECVPNHIYEDWPSASSCGSVTYSCHMKTNNEPGNSSDDHPQDVSTVLANWQNLMRTGMRLCSESSHDGSMSHLKAFIDSIDAYGWRCDLLDLHCYWPSGSFNNLAWYSSYYGNGRPIWISEWVWGASWNNNGIFGSVSNTGDYSTANQQTCYNGTKPILDVLNSTDIVERYAYWNSEAACSKIYKDGSLSILGEYYASMNDGLGYKASNEFIPKVVYKAAENLKGTYTKKTKAYAMTWTDDNGDMLDSITVEVKMPGTTVWKRVTTIEPTDKKSASGATYSYTYTVTDAGAYYFRIASYPVGGSNPKRSSELSLTVSSSNGTDKFQYGKLNITNLDNVVTDFSETFSTSPATFMGICTNRNSSLYPGNLLTSVSKTSFTYKISPWVKQSTTTTSLTNAEEIPFMAIEEGNYQFGGLDAEVGIAKTSMTDTTEVTFAKAFPEGVTPIVITEVKNTVLKTYPLISQIWDVTNTGFKCILTYEEGLGKTTSLKQDLAYFAITPGFGTIDEENGIIVAAGTGANNIYGSIAKSCVYKNDNDTLFLYSPHVFGKCQTRNYPAGAVLRKTSDMIDKTIDPNGTYYYYGSYIKRQVDATCTTTLKDNSSNSDKLGYIIIAEATDYSSVPTSIEKIEKDGDADGTLTPRIVNGVIYVDETDDIEIYDITGKKMNARQSQKQGTYIIKAGDRSIKVSVR